MKKHLILFFAGVILSYGNIKAQTAPDKKEILKVTLQVNDYFMKKYADYRTPSFVKKVVRPSNIWTRSVYYEGLMALYSIYPADEYYLYAKEWADYHQWGFHRGTTTRNADNYCASQIYLDLYNICPDPEKIRKTKANMDMLVNTPQVNDWWWIDAIQMGMPIFAKMGKLTGEQKYFDKMWDMYEYTRNKHGENGMFNVKEGLWWRDHNFDPPYKEPNGKNCYWSRGNGWVYAALVRVMNEIPSDEKHRQDDDKRTALYLLNNVLGGPGMNSKLNVSLRERRGLVYNVESNLTSYTDTGAFCIYFGTDVDDMDTCLKLTYKELKRMRDVKMTSSQLAAAKKQLIGQIGVASDNFENNALGMAKTYLHYHKYESSELVFKRIEELTAEQLLEVANEMFAEEYLSTLIYK